MNTPCEQNQPWTNPTGPSILLYKDRDFSWCQDDFLVELEWLDAISLNIKECCTLPDLFRLLHRFFVHTLVRKFKWNLMIKRFLKLSQDYSQGTTCNYWYKYKYIGGTPFLNFGLLYVNFRLTNTRIKIYLFSTDAFFSKHVSRITMT